MENLENISVDGGSVVLAHTLSLNHAMGYIWAETYPLEAACSLLFSHLAMDFEY